MTLSFGSGFPPLPPGVLSFTSKSQPQKALFGANGQELNQGDAFVPSSAQQQASQAAVKVHKTSALSLLAGGILGAAVAPVNYLLNKMDQSSENVD